MNQIEALEKLVCAFRSLPGVGLKTAQRMLLNTPPRKVVKLSIPTNPMRKIFLMPFCKQKKKLDTAKNVEISQTKKSVTFVQTGIQT